MLSDPQSDHTEPSKLTLESIENYLDILERRGVPETQRKKIFDKLYQHMNEQNRVMASNDGPSGVSSSLHTDDDYIKLIADLESNPNKTVKEPILFSASTGKIVTPSK